MLLQKIALAMGLFLGFFLIVMLTWKYIKKGSLGAGGNTLAIIGFALFGALIWGSIEIEAGGVKLKLSNLEELVDSLTVEVIQVADSNEKAKGQLQDLTFQIQRLPGGSQLNLQPIMQELQAIPKMDQAKLLNIRNKLKSLREKP